MFAQACLAYTRTTLCSYLVRALTHHACILCFLLWRGLLRVTSICSAAPANCLFYLLSRRCAVARTITLASHTCHLAPRTSLCLRRSGCRVRSRRRAAAWRRLPLCSLFCPAHLLLGVHGSGSIPAALPAEKAALPCCAVSALPSSLNVLPVIYSWNVCKALARMLPLCYMFAFP